MLNLAENNTNYLYQIHAMEKYQHFSGILFHCVKRSCYLCSQLVPSSLEHATREAITSLSLIFKACKQVYMIKFIVYWFISEIAFFTVFYPGSQFLSQEDSAYIILSYSTL